MANLHKAIRSIHNQVVTINGNTQESIVATDIDGNEIDINWSAVNSWIDPDQYKINRQAEYPSHEDCIHALLDGGETLENLQTLRQTIKNKYPKE